MTEAELQCQIVDALRLLGCTVLVTSARSYRPAQGERRGYGADRGVPDLLVAPPGAPPSVWLGLEVKSARGRLSPVQKALLDAGRITVVRSVTAAIRAAATFRAAYPRKADDPAWGPRAEQMLAQIGEEQP